MSIAWGVRTRNLHQPTPSNRPTRRDRPPGNSGSTRSSARCIVFMQFVIGCLATVVTITRWGTLSGVETMCISQFQSRRFSAPDSVLSLLHPLPTNVFPVRQSHSLARPTISDNLSCSVGAIFCRDSVGCSNQTGTEVGWINVARFYASTDCHRLPVIRPRL